MMMWNRWGLAALCVLGAPACTLALHWDQDSLPCDSTLTCAAEFSCIPAGIAPRATCVREGSLRMDDRCARSSQCGGDLACAGGHCVAACRREDAFLEADACPPAQVCRNLSDVVVPQGGCIDSDACLAGAACRTAQTPQQGICVPISPTAQACLPSCRISWIGGSYGDTCDADAACQMVGLPAERYLVCLHGSADTASLGASCGNAVTKPCARGLACVAGTCRTYCDPSLATSLCAAPDQCCGMPLAPANPGARAAGYCAASCL